MSSDENFTKMAKWLSLKLINTEKKDFLNVSYIIMILIIKFIKNFVEVYVAPAY